MRNPRTLTSTFRGYLRVSLLSFALFSPLGFASAADDPAVAMFNKGDYAAAADAAAAAGSASGLALAARATLAGASLRDSPCLECLQRAEAFARRAIELDPDNLEGQLQLAVSLGYQARIIGPLRARFQNFPEQAKDAIETSLKLAPDNYWALAAAGGFNIEVVRSGGRILGDLFYGASIDKGIAYFQRAIVAAPDSPVIKLQYALALTSVAFDSHRTEIAAVLDACMRAPLLDSYSEAMKERAGRLLALLHENKRQEFLALARRYQGFPS